MKLPIATAVPLLLLLLLLLAVGLNPVQTAPTAGEVAVQQLFDRYFNWRLEDNPEFAAKVSPAGSFADIWQKLHLHALLLRT